MSDLPPGRYQIVPARRSAPPPFPIGANLEEDSSPVISAGNSNIWTVELLDSGYYTLSLGIGESWFSKGDQDNVVVIPEAAAGEWTIRKRNDSGAYTIEVPGFWPTKAWYLSSTEPGTEVTLRFFEISPWPQQLWTFTPVY